MEHEEVEQNKAYKKYNANKLSTTISPWTQNN
jgi:hypothetical protein